MLVGKAGKFLAQKYLWSAGGSGLALFWPSHDVSLAGQSLRLAYFLFNIINHCICMRIQFEKSLQALVTTLQVIDASLFPK